MKADPMPRRDAEIAIDVDDGLLRAWPLPQPGPESDKEQRGRVLVIGGSREIPGALLLAANAALNAGAGKIALATVASVAPSVATTVPEARVIALPETDSGGIDPTGASQLMELLGSVDAVLVGPGMQDEDAVIELCRALLGGVRDAILVLDAAAMSVARHSQQSIALPRSTIMTPHAGELAHLTGEDKDDIVANAAQHARAAAGRWRATIALKGATTIIATPGEAHWRHTGGNAGLGISGSGDVLAGLIAGLAARGAPPAQATVWGVALHARAGERLAARSGPLGYLPRALSAEVPALLDALAARSADADRS